MKKLLATLIIGTSALAFASGAHAHGGSGVAVQGAVSIGVPIGNNGYAVVGVGPAYYPQPVYYPAPRYYAPAVVYAPPRYVYGGKKHHHKKHGKKHGKSYKKGYKNGYKHGKYDSW